jgi:hypothetical protein
MLLPSDVLHLPYTPDLTETAITFACRTLASSSNLKVNLPLERLREIVGEMALELAFRRALSMQGIPYQVRNAEPFSHPERNEVWLGGHRCELKCSLITHRGQITGLRKDITQALQAHALLPIAGFSAEGYKPEDIHIFALLLGLVAFSGDEIDKALAAGQRACLVHPLPSGWSCTSEWLPLETLVLKSECELPIIIEIGGQDSRREFSTVRLELPPKKRIAVEGCFHSLSYLQTSRRPEGRIGLHIPALMTTHIISPREWGNVWVYGMDILMMGWLSHEEFRRKAKVLNSGMHTFQGGRTHEKNLVVPMKELNPLGPLYKRIQQWAAVPKSPG